DPPAVGHRAAGPVHRGGGARQHDDHPAGCAGRDLAGMWRGCGGKMATNTQAALKLAVRFDLRRGSLVGLDLASGRTQDRATAQQHVPVARGALRIADQGFWSLAVFRSIADGGGYFLSRYHSQITVLLAGRPLDLPRW